MLDLSALRLLGRSRDHLVGVGESYLEHMRFAASVGVTMVGAGLACILHGLLPALFPTTASRAIRRLHAVIERRGLLEEEAPDLNLLLLALLAAGFALLPWAAGMLWPLALGLSILSIAMPIAYVIARRQIESEPL
jgi:uncharacterized protein YjeT (DUF2065 family)